jgi:hypothetical protein
MTEDLHRRFGVEGNNETWRLLDAGPPGPDAPAEERERFLYRAYSSAYHWIETASATPANRARGEHLIARAAIAVGQYEVALGHATRCLELCRANPDAIEDWDLAFAEEAIARAHAGAGNMPAAGEHHKLATDLGAAIQSWRENPGSG